MDKKFEAIIEKYSDTYFSNGSNGEEKRAYEREVKTQPGKNKHYFGYQIRINSNNPQIFARNYVEKVGEHYIIKEGLNFNDSENIHVAHTQDEAYEKAYQNISKKPKQKLEDMMKKCGLRYIIFDKHPVIKFTNTN
jgi:hypothetical protein